jgi:hypothetical protein
VNSKQPLSLDVRSRLLGIIPGQYSQWTYSNSLHDLYSLYVEDGKMQDIILMANQHSFKRLLALFVWKIIGTGFVLFVGMEIHSKKWLLLTNQ